MKDIETIALEYQSLQSRILNSKKMREARARGTISNKRTIAAKKFIQVIPNKIVK